MTLVRVLSCPRQSYEIKSPLWTILWFRFLGIFSVENLKRLCVFMFQTWDNSQLLRRVMWISAEQTIGASLKHKNTQPLYIFNRVRVLHLNRLKEGTWLHSFAFDYLLLHLQCLLYAAELMQGSKTKLYLFQLQTFAICTFCVIGNCWKLRGLSAILIQKAFWSKESHSVAWKVGFLNTELRFRDRCFLHCI